MALPLDPVRPSAPVSPPRRRKDPPGGPASHDGESGRQDRAGDDQAATDAEPPEEGEHVDEYV